MTHAKIMSKRKVWNIGIDTGTGRIISWHIGNISWLYQAISYFLGF